MNRDYVWREIPTALATLHQTKINAGSGDAIIQVPAQINCVVYATAVGTNGNAGLPDAGAGLIAAGFSPTSVMVGYLDQGRPDRSNEGGDMSTLMRVYSKVMLKGETLSIPQDGEDWAGIHLLFP